jgi:hypothetical protein
MDDETTTLADDELAIAGQSELDPMMDADGDDTDSTDGDADDSDADDSDADDSDSDAV